MRQPPQQVPHHRWNLQQRYAHNMGSSQNGHREAFAAELRRWFASSSPFSSNSSKVDRVVVVSFKFSGIWSPRKSALDKTPLQSARKVSSTMVPDKHRPHSHLTLLTMQFGQFISHDISSSVTLMFCKFLFNFNYIGGAD